MWPHRLRMHLANIRRLGVKELWSLWRDPVMLFLILYTFTVAVYTSGTAMPETLSQTPIAIVDEDDSALSARITGAFYPPAFLPPVRITHAEVDALLDAGHYTLVLVIPPGLQRDVLAGRQPTLQLNVDATRMSQAFAGSGYIQQIVLAEINEFTQPPIFIGGGKAHGPRVRDFNPSLNKKVRALGLKMALSSKAKAGLVVVESLDVDAKTKALVGQLAKANWGKKVLVIDGEAVNDNFAKAARNIVGVNVLPAVGANVYDILKHDTLVLTRAAVEKLEARFNG